MSALRSAGLSDLGRRRRNNQDRFVIDEAAGLYIVADGMGGAPSGDVAAQLAVDRVPVLLRERAAAEPSEQLVVEALRRVNDEAEAHARSRPDAWGMGTTLAMAWLRPPRALIAHVGDSRVYHLRGERLRQVTKDHSVIQELVDAGRLTAAEAASHPDRGRVTQCIGTYGPIRPDVRELTMQSGDRLLLCSDGLTGMIADAQIETILAREPDPAIACRALVDAANQAGGADNITVLVVALD